MNLKTWSADFHIVPAGARGWRLTNTGDPGIQIELLGADIEPQIARLAPNRVSVEWLSDAALVEIGTAAGVFRIRATQVLVHEPLPTLYGCLPLAHFDKGAQRFWRRVFWLARLPGGRTLLRLLARRARA